MSYVGIPFQSKRNDTKPFFDRLEREQTPGKGDFAAIDLAGAGVTFAVSDPDTNALLFVGNAVVLTAVLSTDPTVSYTPTPTQMALAVYPPYGIPHKLRVRWRITYASGLTETIPAGRDYLQLIVGEDIVTP